MAVAETADHAGCGRPPVRALVLALTTIAYVAQMGLRLSLSVAIVAMVNHTAIPHVATPAAVACGGAASLNLSLSAMRSDFMQDNSSLADQDIPLTDGHDEVGEFVWDEVMQGTLLSAFYWGYFIMQVPGGFLAERFGSKRVLGVSQTLNALLILLLPTAASLGLGFAMAVRMLQGIVCGPVYPCLFPLIARWFPLDERQMALGVVNAFTHFGMAATSALAGIVSASLGWRAVFYLSGGGTLLWSVTWFALMHETPAEHPLVRAQERQRIEAGNVTQARTKRRPPYLSMLRSPPVLAIVFAETATGWALTYVVTSLPTYMKHVLGLNLEANGLLSGLPNLVGGVSFILVGTLGDLVLRRGWLSTNTIRRTSAAIASVGGAVILLLVTLVGCRPAIATLLFVIVSVINSFITTGHVVNALDISPNYSGTVYSIANTAANLVGILNPVVTGALVQGEQTAERWGHVFYLGAAIYLASLILYQPMMSTERQWWDKQEDCKEKGEEALDMLEAEAKDRDA